MRCWTDRWIRAWRFWGQDLRVRESLFSGGIFEGGGFFGGDAAFFGFAPAAWRRLVAGGGSLMFLVVVVAAAAARADLPISHTNEKLRHRPLGIYSSFGE
jgi:hypothetical protein